MLAYMFSIVCKPTYLADEFLIIFEWKFSLEKQVETLMKGVLKNMTAERLTLKILKIASTPKKPNYSNNGLPKKMMGFDDGTWRIIPGLVRS